MKVFKYKFLSILFVFITSFAFTSGAHAADVFYNYAKGIGSTGADVGNWITIDSSDNSYTTGYFNGTVDFDPGAGTTNLTSAGGNDIFIEKLDSSGNLSWVKQIGGTGSDSGNHVAIDGNGDIFVVGGFAGTVDFDPGVGTTNLSSAGSGDVFILKLDSNGDFISVKQVGGTGDDYATSVTFYSGNIFISGGFASTVDFDPGAGTTNLTSAGNVDMFILKLDSNQDFIWAKRFGGTGWADWIGKTVIDSSGNIYSTGTFGNGTVTDFDPGAGTYNLTPVAGGDWGVDAFIQKLDVNGDFVWAKQFGGNSWDSGTGPVLDSNNNVYITGQFYGTADFDPGAGTANLTSAGNNDTYIVKIDTDGNFVWVKQNGSTGSDDGTALAIDSSDNIYVGGGFAATVDFDPGAGTSNLTSNGVRDIFINKLDSDGNFVWAKALGGSGDDRPNSIAINSVNEYVYTTGYFNSTTDFDPSSDTANLTSAGGNDIFISVLAPDTTSPTLTNISSTPTTTEATIPGPLMNYLHQS